MKRSARFLCVFCTLVLLLSACGGKETVSEGAEAVINACMNTPNEELFSQDAIVYIGGDAPMPEEEKAAALALQEQLNANLEALVGKYFSPGSFDVFLNSYLRSYFFMNPAETTKVVSMELVTKEAKLEVVDVVVDMDGQESTFTITFRSNDDGLFYGVEMAEKA